MLTSLQDTINQVRTTLLAHPEVIAQGTEANATISIDSGEWTLVGDNYQLADTEQVTAYLKPDKEPQGPQLAGVQPSDQFYRGRLINPRTLTVTPRPNQVNPCTIDEMQGEWRWLCADEGAFNIEDIVGTPISGYFRRT